MANKVQNAKPIRGFVDIWMIDQSKCSKFAECKQNKDKIALCSRSCLLFIMLFFYPKNKKFRWAGLFSSVYSWEFLNFSPQRKRSMFIKLRFYVLQLGFLKHQTDPFFTISVGITVLSIPDWRHIYSWILSPFLPEICQRDRACNIRQMTLIAVRLRHSPMATSL